jgi:hypothetical protein
MLYYISFWDPEIFYSDQFPGPFWGQNRPSKKRILKWRAQKGIFCLMVDTLRLTDE